MYGELTDKTTIEAVNHALDNHIHDQFEILLYKKNRKLQSFGRNLIWFRIVLALTKKVLMLMH